MSDKKKMYELYNKKIFLSQEDLNKNEEYKKSKKRVCGKDALKGNLLDNITYGIPNEDKDSQYFYYFKMSEEKVTAIKVNKRFPKEVELSNENDNPEIIKLRTENLKTVGEAIIYYYSEIVKYFQIKIASLDIERLYKDYSEEGLKEIEDVMQEITLFYAKMYYKYPIQEERKTSIKLHKEIQDYNIDEQFNELEKTISLIRDIIAYQLERKREKENKIEEAKKEKWNIIFTIIGILLAIIQVIQPFLN